MDSPFDHCGFDIFVAQRNVRLEPVIQGFMQIYNHDDAGFNGNAEESDVADPYRYAEVIAEQLLQNEAARHPTTIGNNR